MNALVTDKLRRVGEIYKELLELEKIDGRLAPSPHAWLQPSLRTVKQDGAWSARILDDSFITIARMTKKNVGETILHAPGWTSVELLIQGQCRLAFSIKDGVIILHRYKPGLWENWFGVDNAGDTIALNPELFADDKDPRWARFNSSGLAEYPPRLNFDAADPTSPKA